MIILFIISFVDDYGADAAKDVLVAVFSIVILISAHLVEVVSPKKYLTFIFVGVVGLIAVAWFLKKK